MTKGIGVLFCVATLGGAASGLAQENGIAREDVVVAPATDAYGTSSLTVYQESSMNFVGRSSTNTYATGGGVDRFLTAGTALQASPHIPTGAQIERIELRACDTSATESVALVLGTCPTAGSTCTLAGQVTTGPAGDTPGCSDFSSTLGTPVIVNNQTTPLLLSVSTGSSTAASFTAVKLYYRLRVSPAPAVATFPNDVPTTHPFFRFVEAMAASGLTGGCGPGAFCPDQPVTRGQMSVFLANALGLHFPN